VLLRGLDAAGKVRWELWCIDGSNLGAYKAAAGGGQPAPHEPADHALARSHGGLGSKLHLLSDSARLPLVVWADRERKRRRLPPQGRDRDRRRVELDAVNHRCPLGRAGARAGRCRGAAGRGVLGPSA
jgi:hypothetical protein